MVAVRRNSRLTNMGQRALIVQVVAGTPARTAAQLVGVNRHTATLYYHKFSQTRWRSLRRTSYRQVSGLSKVTPNQQSTNAYLGQPLI